jgi:hypothetical protein
VESIFAVLGLVIVLVMILDVVRTTVAVDSGSGWVSGLITRLVWEAVLRISGSGTRRRALRQTGIAISLGTIALWIVLGWAGWSLVFLGGRDAVVVAATGEPAGPLARVYFAGTTLFTLGLGDYEPRGLVWEAAAVLTAGSGLLLVTLSIAYLIPVAAAATGKRQLAAYVSALGTSPWDILRHAWNGRDFHALDPHLVALAPMLTILAQRHLAYPVLHYFHATERHNASAPAIAALDEALGLLEHGVPAAVRPERLSLLTLRRAVWDYLETLDSTFLEPAPEPPPITSLQPLRDDGIPALDDEVYTAGLEVTDRRRRLLAALVVDDGYRWDDVVQPESPEHFAPAEAERS